MSEQRAHSIGSAAVAFVSSLFFPNKVGKEDTLTRTKHEGCPV